MVQNQNQNPQVAGCYLNGSDALVIDDIDGTWTVYYRDDIAGSGQTLAAAISMAREIDARHNGSYALGWYGGVSA